jgi:hypothetical protein
MNDRGYSPRSPSRYRPRMCVSLAAPLENAALSAAFELAAPRHFRSRAALQVDGVRCRFRLARIIHHFFLFYDLLGS